MATKYKVSGMTCGGCVRSVTNAITARDGSAKVEVDLPTGIVSVEGDLSEDAVKDAVEGAGFDFGGTAAAA
jgi:copper chaperone